MCPMPCQSLAGQENGDVLRWCESGRGRDVKYDEGGEQDLEYDGSRDGHSHWEGQVNASL
jgi:hypothetical protein